MSDFGGRFQRHGENESYRHLQYLFVYYYCAQNCFFTDPLSNKYLFYKGRRLTFPAMRSETAGPITVRKMV